MSRAAVAQLCSTADKIANLVAIARSASLAKQSGASMVSTFKHFTCLSWNYSRKLIIIISY